LSGYSSYHGPVVAMHNIAVSCEIVQQESSFVGKLTGTEFAHSKSGDESTRQKSSKSFPGSSV